MKLTFEIRLNSDYHIGAGLGLGEAIDSALQRDADGLPVIRGTTVAGLLRDALLRLLAEVPALAGRLARHPSLEVNGEEPCQSDEPSPFLGCAPPADPCPLCRILGSQGFPKAWRISSARPIGNAAPLRRPEPIGGVATARNRVDPSRRRALDRHLFIQEEGDASLRFELTAEADGDTPSLRADAALLTAAARLVRRLGSARRRGRGECVWVLTAAAGIATHQDPQAALLDLFERHWLKAEPITLDEPGSASPAKEPLHFSPTNAWHRWRVILRTDEPVLIAERAAAGNQFSSLGYIDGGQLWGALGSAVARRRGWAYQRLAPDQDYAAFLGLFLRGGLSVTPLYPAVTLETDELLPTIPAPLDLLTCKYRPGFGDQTRPLRGGHGARGWASSDKAPGSCGHRLNEEDCGAPLVPMAGFQALSEPSPWAGEVTAKFQEEIHPRIDPRSARVDAGALFGYRALAQGQYFIGEIAGSDAQAVRDVLAASGIRPGIAASLRLGKATRRGYGKVTLVLEPIDQEAPVFGDCWRDADPLAAAQADQPFALTLTLVTDAILTDPWGRAVSSLDAATVREALLGAAPVHAEVIAAYSRVRIIDGFSGHLGLPRWRDLALVAGSAAGLRIKPRADAAPGWGTDLRQRLIDLQLRGIGLRREEGFGRFVIDHPIYNRFEHAEPMEVPLPKSLEPAPLPAGPVAKQAKRLEDWSKALDQFFAKPENRRPFADPKKPVVGERWRAFARWLHANAATDLDDLSQLIKERVGRDPGLAMVPSQGRDDKDNWFDDGAKGQLGRERVLERIDAIRQLQGRQSHQAILVQMLAERLMDLASADQTETP